MKYNRRLASLLALPVLTLATSLPLCADPAPALADAEPSSGAVQVSETSSAAMNAEQSSTEVVERQKAEPKKLNFRTALARTAKHSSTLKVARSNVEQAKWDTKKVLLGHNPRISFDVNYKLTTPEAVIRIDKMAMATTPTHAYNAALVLEQSLYTFGRLHYAELAARLNEEYERENFRSAYEASLHKTAMAYIECLLAKDQLDISKRQLALREQSLRDAEALFNAGSTAKFDVLRVKAAVSSTKQAVIVAENHYRLAMASLCDQVSYPIDTELELQDVTVDESVPTDLASKVDFESSLKSAMACRPELHMIDWAIKAAEANYELAGNSSNPNLAFQTALSGNGSNSNVGQNWGWNYTAGLVFSVPLYDGGERKVAQGKLKEAIRQLRSRLDGAINDVTLDVKNCHYNLITCSSRINEAQTSLEQAQEADRVAVIRYTAGLSTSTELLDAHTTLGLAEEALSAAKYGYFKSVVDWVRAISGRYPIDGDGMLDQDYLSAKPADWYDLRKQADERYDEVIEDRLNDPSNSTFNAKYNGYWLKKREELHQAGYTRAGLTPEEDSVLESGQKDK